MKSVKTFSVSRIFKQVGYCSPALVLAWIFVPSQSFAKSGETVSVQIGDRQVSMIDVPKRHLMISKGCKGKSGFACQAYSVFMQTKKSSQTEGKTPPEVGSDICVQAHGAVKVGTTASKDEITLCYFSKDRSYIDIGSLYAQTQGF